MPAILKTLALVVSVPLIASSAPAPEFVTNTYVHQVVCERGKGTAFRVGRNTVVSVAHVTSLAGCKIEGEAPTVTYQSAADFAVLRAPNLPTGGLRISCEGFKVGEFYVALGYARGEPRIQRVIVQATDIAGPRGFTTLVGEERYIPGMSGGPVISQRGEVVGVVNAYNKFFPLSFSRSLAETPLCERSA